MAYTNLYNPINLTNNNWNGVDNTLSGGGFENRTFISDIILSGNTLFFGGKFIYNYTNVDNFANYQLPTNPALQVINIGYFDTTSNRIRSLKGIGTATQVITGANRVPAVFKMAMSGSNLVVAGNFNLINTQITSFRCTAPINRTQFYTLSDTVPFNANVTVGQVIDLSAYNLLFTTLYTNSLPGNSFTPQFSGDFADSIAYYSPTNQKWNAFPNGTSINFNGSLQAVAEYNNRIYTAGTYLSGSLFYNDGTQWVDVTPNMSVNRYLSAECLSLYNDSRGNLIYCGTFSGFNGDLNKTGIMGYNGSTFFSLGSGLSGDAPYASAVILSGDNYIACGSFDDRIAFCNRPLNSNFKQLYNGANNFSFDEAVYNIALSGSALIFCGYFDNLNSVATRVGTVTVAGDIASLNGPIDSDITLWNNFMPVTIFANVPVDYTLDSTISGDFTTISLQSLGDSLNTVSGLSAYGSSPYQGISGINITP
jgi:hypothetical protein